MELRSDEPGGSRIWRRLSKAVSGGGTKHLGDHFAGQLLEELSRWSARGSTEDLDDDITMVAIHVKELARGSN